MRYHDSGAVLSVKLGINYKEHQGRDNEPSAVGVRKNVRSAKASNEFDIVPNILLCWVK
jgi:hypothetical protein